MHPEDAISNDFVLHGQLWVFADEYIIEPLKGLALHKLHRDLLAYDIRPEHSYEVIQLIRYTFENTAATRKEVCATQLDLRELVVHYAACKLETLVQNKEFETLIEEGGKFASSLTTLIVQRFK